MSKYQMGEFIKRFADVAADSDYSRYTQLQDISQFDIDAAARALWQHTAEEKKDAEETARDLIEADVLRVLLAQVEHYMDSNDLVSVNYEGYWDMTDSLIGSPGLRKQIEEYLSAQYLLNRRTDGQTVVDGEHGIWFFRLKG